jgi:hypothetical protein
MKKRSAKIIETNLEILRPSTSPPERGDIFVVKPKGREYYFGRVINSDVKLLSWQGYLIYIYDSHSPSKESIPSLRRDRLLIPPQIIEPSCWKKGYLQRVDSRPFEPNEILPQHCFLDVVRKPKRYVDEHNIPVACKTEPYGVYGVALIRGLDKRICEALGIPIPPAT